MGCSNVIPKSYKEIKCINDFHQIRKIDIQSDKLFLDYKYFGDIIERTDDYIKVKCNNGNRYMKDEIYTLYL